MERTTDTVLGTLDATSARIRSDMRVWHGPILDDQQKAMAPANDPGYANADDSDRHGTIASQPEWVVSVAATGVLFALTVALTLPASTQASPALQESGIAMDWLDAMSYTFELLVKTSRLLQDVFGGLVQRITDEVAGWTYAIR